MAGPSKDRASLDAVQKWFSNALGAQTAKQLARAIDTDKSGYVDVLEYMQFWCVQIGGTNSEKITTFFNLLDADGKYNRSSGTKTIKNLPAPNIRLMSIH